MILYSWFNIMNRKGDSIMGFKIRESRCVPKERIQRHHRFCQQKTRHNKEICFLMKKAHKAHKIKRSF